LRIIYVDIVRRVWLHDHFSGSGTTACRERDPRTYILPDNWDRRFRAVNAIVFGLVWWVNQKAADRLTRQVEELDGYLTS
jgi:hypothetical protein